MEVTKNVNGGHQNCNENERRSNGQAEASVTVIRHSDDQRCITSSSNCTNQNQNVIYHRSCNTTDLMAAAMTDDVTAQLAASGWQKQHLNGPVGMAAAAAIVSAKKRKRPHSFETNPSIRKRQQNRLLRKLRQTIDEFSTRVGQQAVVLVATPGKENSGFRCFGAKPLEDVVKNIRSIIMDELESALAQHAPPPIPDDPSLYELPPLILDGIPTPVEKMTQAQLRAFIPLMLKYSTGRGKPGWGRDTTKPPWWPVGLPWANVRMDARTEEEKQKISWTKALRQIVINCYKFHGREDLLPVFTEDDENKVHPTPPDSPPSPPSCPPTPPSTSNSPTVPHYTSAVLQTINNPDGTVSIIHVDPNNPIITLPDGTTAHVQGLLHAAGSGENGQTVHTVRSLSDVTTSRGENVSVDILNNVTEATLNQDGQIILTSEDGHGYPVTVSGVLTVPVSASMYQTVVANIQHIHHDGTVQALVHVPKMESTNGTMEGSGNMNGNEVEAITVTPHQVIAVGNSGESQVLQVISIKDAATMKTIAALNVSNEIKSEDMSP